MSFFKRQNVWEIGHFVGCFMCVLNITINILLKSIVIFFNCLGILYSWASKYLLQMPRIFSTLMLIEANLFRKYKNCTNVWTNSIEFSNKTLDIYYILLRSIIAVAAIQYLHIPTLLLKAWLNSHWRLALNKLIDRGCYCENRKHKSQ